MPAGERQMLRRSGKTRQAFWERGYLSHGYWLGTERLGSVKLGPKKEWDGIYRWQAGSHSGETTTLEGAKQAVEQVVLAKASQLPLFDK